MRDCDRNAMGFQMLFCFWESTAPTAKSDASVSRRNCPSLLGIEMIGAEVMSDLSLSKARVWSGVHLNGTFPVRSFNGQATLAKSLINRR